MFIDFTNVDIEEYMKVLEFIGNKAKKHGSDSVLKITKERWIYAKQFRDKNILPWEEVNDITIH